MDSLKLGEKGQTIRSNNSSSGGVDEGAPFAEMFSTNTADKDSLRGTQLNRSLQNLNDPDGPNEEADLRGRNIIMKKTITEYPESGRTVVKTLMIMTNQSSTFIIIMTSALN